MDNTFLPSTGGCQVPPGLFYLFLFRKLHDTPLGCLRALNRLTAAVSLHDGGFRVEPASNATAVTANIARSWTSWRWLT